MLRLDWRIDAPDPISKNEMYPSHRDCFGVWSPILIQVHHLEAQQVIAVGGRNSKEDPKIKIVLIYCAWVGNMVLIGMLLFPILCSCLPLAK